jgi:hypothetical protein
MVLVVVFIDNPVDPNLLIGHYPEADSRLFFKAPDKMRNTRL